MTDECICCTFPNEAALYLAYMPFVKGGGLFIRNNNPEYTLGQEVEMTVQLLNEPEPYKTSGKVVWITPKGAQGNKPSGVGFQFIGDNSRSICNKIETYLAGMLKSAQLTDTI